MVTQIPITKPSSYQFAKIRVQLGRVDKLRNHVHEFGLTNAVFATSSYLLSSSVNLDTGNSAINIRSLTDLSYLGSLNRTGRIVCLCAVEDPTGKNLVRIVTGGTQLTLLEAQPSSGSTRSKYKNIQNPNLLNSI